VTWSQGQQRWVKDPPDQPGYNFVWSPQWQVQMHQPETWGWVQFSTTQGEVHVHARLAAPPAAYWGCGYFIADPVLPISEDKGLGVVTGALSVIPLHSMCGAEYCEDSVMP
jgi:hypothetical protein